MVRKFWSAATAALAQVTHAHPGALAAALILFLTGFAIVGFRWRLILRALGCPATLWDTTLTYAAGVGVSNVTPARTLGADALRLTVISSRTGASVRLAAASIVYDRLSEVPAIAVLALLTVARLRAYRWTVAAIVVGAVVLAFARPVRRAIAARIGHWHETLVGEQIPSRSVAAAIALAALLYLQDTGRIFLIAGAFDVWLTPAQTATMTVLRLIGGAAPVPGGLGVVEGSQIAGLVLFGIPTETAAAITIVERAILYVCGTAVGLVALALLGGRSVVARLTR
jgi:uncharacterized membrane protein YbhN (UPF0104 family)